MKPPPSTVRGNCPMGCGETLFLGDEGHVTCSLRSCPDPAAVDKILAERETEHVVHFRAGDFTIRHPLRERVDSKLEDCELHEYLASLDGPPVKPGTYRATRYRIARVGEKWSFEEVRP